MVPLSTTHRLWLKTDAPGLVSYCWQWWTLKTLDAHVHSPDPIEFLCTMKSKANVKRGTLYKIYIILGDSQRHLQVFRFGFSVTFSDQNPESAPLLLVGLYTRRVYISDCSDSIWLPGWIGNICLHARTTRAIKRGNLIISHIQMTPGSLSPVTVWRDVSAFCRSYVGSTDPPGIYILRKGVSVPATITTLGSPVWRLGTKTYKNSSTIFPNRPPKYLAKFLY